ncbi:MAG: hypothetical protein O7A06_06815 [Acidobacteria bacterium]|nr:hypothetical protein [Acidobacteriota bacterium]
MAKKLERNPWNALLIILAILIFFLYAFPGADLHRAEQEALASLLALYQGATV